MTRRGRRMPVSHKRTIVLLRGNTTGTRIRRRPRVSVTESLMHLKTVIVEVSLIRELQSLSGLPDLSHRLSDTEITASGVNSLTLPNASVNRGLEISIRVILSDILRGERRASQVVQTAKVSINPDCLEPEQRGNLR